MNLASFVDYREPTRKHYFICILRQEAQTTIAEAEEKIGVTVGVNIETRYANGILVSVDRYETPWGPDIKSVVEKIMPDWLVCPARLKTPSQAFSNLLQLRA